jgi:hypothetical protein
MVLFDSDYVLQASRVQGDAHADIIELARTRSRASDSINRILQVDQLTDNRRGFYRARLSGLLRQLRHYS